jgi:putative SOS response-associated peptidase YedK
VAVERDHRDHRCPRPAGQVHYRTPMIHPRDRVDAWLNPNLTDPDQVRTLLTGIDLDPLELRRVATAVNNVRANGSELIEPPGDEADRPLELALA